MTDEVSSSLTDEVPQKKGLSTLAWIGIGCGALVVIVSVVLLVVGLFAAKKFKDVAGDLDFEDLKDGRFTVTTDEGDVTIDASEAGESGTISVTKGDETWRLKTGVETRTDIPAWVPVPSGAEVLSPQVVESEGKTTGGFQLRSTESFQSAVEFYRSRLESDGMSVRVNEFAAGEGEAGAVVNGSGGDGGRAVTVMIRTDDDGSTKFVVSFQEGSGD